MRVEKYFEGTASRATPDLRRRRGHGLLLGRLPRGAEEAIEILRLFDSQTDTKMPRLHIVFGKYEGKIQARPGEKVVFIGDCATWKGDIAGAGEDREAAAPRNEEPHEGHDDIYAKMAKVTWRLLRTRRWTMRLGVSPVSVAEKVLACCRA